MSSTLFGLTKEKAERLYELLKEELANRIEEIQEQDKILNELKLEPKELIEQYTTAFLEERKQMRRICSQDPQWADFYFISRVIGSCTNAREKRNTFKSYFTDFLSADDIKLLDRLPWITNRPLVPNEYGYWDYMFKLLQTNELGKDRSGLSQILYQFNVKKIAQLTDGTELLEKFRKQAKNNVQSYNEALWEKADEIPFEPKKYNCNSFQSSNGLFPILSRCLVESCKYVIGVGGSANWLKILDKELDINNSNIKGNAEGLCKQIDQWPGYGRALAEDFFKDMGFDYFGKPDRHVIRVLEGLNIPLGDKPEEKVNEFLNHFASQIGNGVTANQIDKIIWLLMSGRFYKHTNQAYPLDGRNGKHNKSSAMCRRILKKLQ